MENGLRRELGMAAVAAVVAGDMLGSGIFFTPGEMAGVAHNSLPIYFIWTLCGLITLCGALTLGTLSAAIPRSGATYHMIREGFGPMWSFVKIWTEMWISGPGSVAGVAIIFGTYFAQLAGSTPLFWG